MLIKLKYTNGICEFEEDFILNKDEYLYNLTRDLAVTTELRNIFMCEDPSVQYRVTSINGSNN